MQMEFTDWQNIIWIIMPLLVIQIALIITALWDWYNRRKILGQNRIIWLVIILFFSLIGPIIYLFFTQRLTKEKIGTTNNMDDWRS